MTKEEEEAKDLVHVSKIMIGNYYLNDKNIPCVFTYDLYETYLFEGVKPIPLDEEWLIKFGFEQFKEYKYGNSYIKKSFYFDLECLMLGRFYPNEKNSEKYSMAPSSITIEFVHQLQNLYFALTGNELTIK